MMGERRVMQEALFYGFIIDFDPKVADGALCPRSNWTAPVRLRSAEAGKDREGARGATSDRASR